MSSKKTKTCKRYPSKDALKKGCPSTIESACTKIVIASAFVEKREKYNTMKNEYEKLQVKLEQMEQLKKDNDTKLKQLSNKNKIINDQNTTIIQLNNDIKLLKETSVHRNETNILEGKLKKKDHTIKELEKQICQTKLNNLYHLENTIHKLKERIEYLTEGYGKFNIEDESLSKANQGLKEENESLKEGIERLKGEHGELLKKVEKFEKAITDLYDDF